MYMAIAVVPPKSPENRENYKVWFLKLDRSGNTIGIGLKDRKEVIASLFKNYKKSGGSNWRALLKDSESSSSIELCDFLTQNTYHNTHFGNLPTISEFQTALNYLHLNFEYQAAS